MSTTAIQLTAMPWVRDKESICATLNEVIRKVVDVISNVKTTCDCSASINKQELKLLQCARTKLEELSFEMFKSSRPLFLAAKLEVVIKAVRHVDDKLFPSMRGSTWSSYCPMFGGFMIERENGPLKEVLSVPASHLGVCGRQLSISPSRWSGTACTKPLAVEFLSPVLGDIVLGLAGAQDDLHMAHIMMNILGGAPAANLAWFQIKVLPNISAKEEACSEARFQAVQEVDHPEEFVAVRDEGLLQEQADHDWADAVSAAIHQSVGPEDIGAEEMIERVFLFPYMRAPETFKTALLEGPELRPIREKMHASGYDCVLQPSGAKIFVYPEQFEEVKAELMTSQIPLRASNVIISESMIPALEASMAEIPSKKNVRVKANGIVQVAAVSMPASATSDEDQDIADPTVSAGNEATNWEHVYGTKPIIIVTLRSSKSVNQSTTEAHGGMNPRRYTVDPTFD